MPGDKIPEVNLGEGLELLWSMRHQNKLKTGHLIGNRFDITVRDVNPSHVVYVNDQLKQIKKNGLPNLYGPQRFGNGSINPRIGKSLLVQDWETCVLDLIKSKARFANKWSDALQNGKSFIELCNQIPKNMCLLYLNAFQSELFNKVLIKRKDKNLLNSCIEGDLIWAHAGRGSSFYLNNEEAFSKQFIERVSRCEVSPTGPIFGTKMRKPKGIPFEIEEEILQDANIEICDFALGRKLLKGARRPLRVPIDQVNLTSGADNHGNFIRIQFELPAGSYATVAIDYLLGVLP